MQAEKLLIDLVAQNKISFNEADLKAEKNPTKRKLLYMLGAYKGVCIPKDNLYCFGIRACKKLIDKDIEPSFANVIKAIYAQERDNFIRVINKDPLDLMNKIDTPWIKKVMLKYLKSWKNIDRGKKVFIPGMGSFDIEKAYKDNIGDYDYVTYTILPDIMSLRCAGYFPDEVNGSYQVRALYKHSIELFRWFYIHDFPIALVDEVKDLDILGLFNLKMNPTTVNARIADLRKRHLGLAWDDKYDFKYPDNIISFANENGFDIPKNGIELKKQAKVFSNCSGGYVKRIRKGKTFIIYNEEEMIEINPKGQILQHYGKRNSKVSFERMYEIRESIRRYYDNI